MEHRWSARIPFLDRVTLYRNKMPVAVCVAKNISVGGLFVATGSLQYPRNTTLDIDIKLHTERGPARYRIPACVTYCSQEGIGLEFLDHNEQVSHSIRQMLRNGQQDRLPQITVGSTPKLASG